MNNLEFRAWEGEHLFYPDLYWFEEQGYRTAEDIKKDGIIIEQFTGLLDRKGVKIFAGDILTDDTGDILEVKFGKLPLSKSGDCVCTYEAFHCKNYGQLGQAPCYECQEIGDWMEVKSNIHESAELLK